MTNPFIPLLEEQSVVMLDGGLATTLESYGYDLDDPLWSARVLLEEPEAVRRAHRDFLEAGADCISTVTYQATHAGFAGRGLSAEEADAALRRAAQLAVEARDSFWAEPSNRRGRGKPLVAGSVGPYGAFLADGSEYTGDYGLDTHELRRFHERRWQVLSESGVDLLACETIPSAVEADAILSLLGDSPGVWAWLSFQCRDGAHLADGTPLASVLDRCAGAERLAAVGVNCVPPGLVAPLVTLLVDGLEVPVAAYPNSGEHYDPVSKTWSAGHSDGGLAPAVGAWMEQGVRVIGGCCRVAPGEISRMRSEALRHG